jgi:site-specific recombinase XerD
MTVRAIQRLVADLREKACLALPVTPHSFRKHFATRVARLSNVRVAQKLLGHKRLNTVEIYTFPSNEELAAVVDLLDKEGRP